MIDTLKDIISKGVAIDIFKAEQAFALLNEIGKRSEVINRENFGHLFGNLQDILVEQIILAVNKIYEHPNRRYPIRSIPVALKILEENTDDPNKHSKPMFAIKSLRDKKNCTS